MRSCPADAGGQGGAAGDGLVGEGVHGGVVKQSGCGDGDGALGGFLLAAAPRAGQQHEGAVLFSGQPEGHSHGVMVSL